MIEIRGFLASEESEKVDSFFKDLSKNNISIVRINFPDKDSIKIIPYFDSIDVDEVSIFKNQIDDFLNIDLRLIDVIGKLHIVIFKLINDNDNTLLILNDIAIGKKSLEFFYSNFKKIVNSYFIEKKIFLLFSSNV